MTLRATGALAPTFTHTQDASWDFRLTPDDISPATVQDAVASGPFRMCLAPAPGFVGALADFLRAIEGSMNAALNDDSDVEVGVALSAAGVVTMTFTGDVSLAEFAAPVWRRLGLASGSIAPVDKRTITGVRPVWYLALITSSTHGPYQPRQPGGAELTNGGRAYTFASGVVSYQRDAAVEFQPLDPAFRASLGCEASPLFPDPAYRQALGSTATARAWSVLDVLRAAANAECALALHDWPVVRLSTTASYDVGYVTPATLLSPKLTARDPSWESYNEWTLGFSLPTTGSSGTRA